MTRLTLTSAAVLLLVLSCSGGSGDSDTPGGPDSVANEIGGSDSQVQPGDTSADSPAAPAVECTVDEDCAGGRVCDCVGACVDPGTQPCEEDKNCGGGNYCDPCIKWCFKKKVLCQGCRSEHLCNPVTGQCMPTGNQCDVDGSRCLDFVSGGSFCGQACLSDAGCPGGYTCQDLTEFGFPVMQCIPISGNCGLVGECDKDSDCEFGSICNKDKMCAPGCKQDTECPNDMVCSGFRCQPGCDPVNNPCPEGQECDGAGHCKIPGGCIDYKDCLEPETYCNQDSHTCQPGCEMDIDCKSSAKICEGSDCVAKGCDATYWCSFGEICELETAECIEPEEPFCEPGCQDDAECGPEPSKCLNLQDEDGNDMGPFCFPKCYDDPENPCPQGYQCTELQDQDGASMGKVCARACHKNPISF
jgi:hypothetical protein